MRIATANLVRLAVVAAVLSFAAQSAEAQRSAATPRGTIATAAANNRPGRAADPDEATEETRGDPMAGLLWIAGALAALIFLAWLAMRIGENPRPADGVPN